LNFFNSNCSSLATGFSFESNKKEIVQFLANPEVETDLKADRSYIEKLLVRSKDNNVANKQIGGDAVERNYVTKSTCSGWTKSSRPKALFLWRVSNWKKVNETGSMMSGNTSSRLSALQQYLTSISSKSG
jgi:hypothetical protein